MGGWDSAPSVLSAGIYMEFVEDTGGTNFAFVIKGGYTWGVGVIIRSAKAASLYWLLTKAEQKNVESSTG